MFILQYEASDINICTGKISEQKNTRTLYMKDYVLHLLHLFEEVLESSKKIHAKRISGGKASEPTSLM
jgi:ribosomal protein S17